MNTTTVGNQSAAVVARAADTGNFVVVWNSEAGGQGRGIYGQMFNAVGTTLGGEFEVIAGDAKKDNWIKSIAMDADGDFVIVYNRTVQRKVFGDDFVSVQRYDAAGVAQGRAIKIDPLLINPSAAVGMASNGDFVVVWDDDGPIVAQRYNSSGKTVGSTFQVSAVDGINRSANVAMDPAGNFVVTWFDYNLGSGGANVGQVINTDGTFRGNAFIFGAFGARRAAMSMQPDGDFVLAWNHHPLNKSADIVARRFHANGSPKEGEFLVNTTLAGDQLVPSVAVDADGNFTVVWSGEGPGDDDGVFAQRYAAPAAPPAAGITVIPTAGLMTSETGANDSFTIILDTQPTADVSVGISSSDTTEGTVNVSSLTFTPANWNVAQTVTVTGVDDPDVDGDVAYTILTAPATGAAEYVGIDAADVSVTNLDNDIIPVITIDDVTVTEGTETEAVFTVSLSSPSPLSVTVDFSTADGTATAGLDYTAVSGTITFATGVTTKTILVPILDDAISESTEIFFLNLANATGATIVDSSGRATIIEDQVVIIGEDFESGSLGPAWTTYSSNNKGRIQVTGKYGTAGGSFALLMDRKGGGVGGSAGYVLNEAVWTVDLSGQIFAGLSFWHAEWFDNVNNFDGDFADHFNADGIAIRDGSNGVWHPIWDASVQFGTLGIWENTVIDLATAAAVHGLSLTSNFQIKFQQYDNGSIDTDGRGWDEITIFIPEIPTATPAILVTPTSGLVTTEGGGFATFTVVLTTQPTGSVFIHLVPSDTTEGRLQDANSDDQTLEFDEFNYDDPQEVTVIGVDDFLFDDDVFYEIIIEVSFSDDSDYLLIDPHDVTLINVDDEGSPLHAAAGGAGDGTGAVTSLTQATLQVVVDQAVALWQAAGIDAHQAAVLNTAHVQVADFSGSLLGIASSSSAIWIDRNAAGFGWSTDISAVNPGRVDLLSVVSHELGHLVGFDHHMMGATLGTGVRRLATSSFHPALRSGGVFGVSSDLPSASRIGPFLAGGHQPLFGLNDQDPSTMENSEFHFDRPLWAERASRSALTFDAVSGRFFADHWDDHDDLPVPFVPDDEEEILDLVFENIDGDLLGV